MGVGTDRVASVVVGPAQTHNGDPDVVMVGQRPEGRVAASLLARDGSARLPSSRRALQSIICAALIERLAGPRTDVVVGRGGDLDRREHARHVPTWTPDASPRSNGPSGRRDGTWRIGRGWRRRWMRQYRVALRTAGKLIRTI